MIDSDTRNYIEIEFLNEDADGVASAAIHPTLDKIRYYLDRAISVFSAAVLLSAPSVPSEASRTQAPIVPEVQILEPHAVPQNMVEEYNQLQKGLEEAAENRTIIHGPTQSLR